MFKMLRCLRNLFLEVPVTMYIIGMLKTNPARAPFFDPW